MLAITDQSPCSQLLVKFLRRQVTFKFASTLIDNKMLTLPQFGFRLKHSTEIAVSNNACDLQMEYVILKWNEVPI